MSENPTPKDLDLMIEAIFIKCDSFRTQHELDAPGNVIGFTELMRLTFEQDEQGRAIFATMDEALLEMLFKMYDERRRNTQALQEDI